MSEVRYQKSEKHRGQDASGEMNGVEQLTVFQRAYDLSLLIHKASLTFPQIEQYALADQIRRASKSICANLTEGFAKQPHSKAEFRRFVSMALGSSDEMALWVRYCIDLGYIDRSVGEGLKNDYHSISRMLHGLHKKL